MKEKQGAPDAIKIGAVEIPVSDYVSQGNAILGIRDSGKSYTATFLAEQLLQREIPFIAFDPIGVWKYLRHSDRREGWHVLIAGGESGDVPLSPDNCAQIVRHAMKHKLPLIFDLYDMRLSKADWRRIVGESIRILLYENKTHGPRHVFIEEAAEFVPQMVTREYGTVYAEIEKLARMGGNAMLGYTLINQRAEQLNKAVLELCDCLFLHRQKGRLSLTALSKWLDFGNKQESARVIESLPMLEQGACWIWGNGSDRPVFTHVPKKQSFHPNRRQIGDPGPRSEVPQMLAGLELSAPKKEHDRPNSAPAEKPDPIDPIFVSVFEPGDLAKLQDAAEMLREFQSRLQDNLNDVGVFLKRINEALQRADRMNNPPKAYVPPPKVRTDDGKPTTLAKGPQKILNVLASKYPGRLTFSQIGTLSGFTPSTMRTYFPGLRADGMIDENADGIRISEKALEAGSYSFTAGSMPKGGQTLVNFWKSKLGTGEGVILQVLFDQRRECSLEALEEMTTYTPSTLRTYIPTLRRNGLIHPTELRISPSFL